MIVNIAIHVPDIGPDSDDAVHLTDIIEAHMMQTLTPLMGRLCTPQSTQTADWWIDVVNGETRDKPENVSKLS